MPALRIVRAVGIVTVQDLGRSGYMHAAVPCGGALVRRLLVAANQAVGNGEAAPGLEVCGMVRVRAEGALDVAVDGVGRKLEDGEELEVTGGASARAVYLAVRGGIDAPARLGSRGTLLCAGFGRVLRAGDVLSISPSPSPSPKPSVSKQVVSGSGSGTGTGTGRDGIRVIPGPALDDFAVGALDTLLSSTYKLRPDSDRVGTRLSGSALTRATRDVASPRPLVRGAIEVPGDGLPIVLGPEHPTTGGYPVIAVVADADLDRMFAIPLGGAVRFIL